VDDCFC